MGVGGGRNLQRQKGGILSVIIYREPPPALLCNTTPVDGEKTVLPWVDAPLGSCGLLISQVGGSVLKSAQRDMCESARELARPGPRVESGPVSDTRREWRQEWVFADKQLHANACLGISQC